MSILIGNSGVKNIREMYIGIGGVPRKVQEGYIGVGGQPRKFYSSVKPKAAKDYAVGDSVGLHENGTWVEMERRGTGRQERRPL